MGEMVKFVMSILQQQKKKKGEGKNPLASLTPAPATDPQ